MIMFVNYNEFFSLCISDVFHCLAFIDGGFDNPVIVFLFVYPLLCFLGGVERIWTSARTDCPLRPLEYRGGTQISIAYILIHVIPHTGFDNHTVLIFKIGFLGYLLPLGFEEYVLNYGTDGL